MAAHYDDPDFSYEKYWLNRQYEQKAEEIAIKKLLKGIKKDTAVDVGGGYGRLTPLLVPHAKKVSLIEPSIKQRQIAKKFLFSHPSIEILAGVSDKTGLKDSSQDIAMMVRVTHHLPDLKPTFAELYRILKPGGLLLLEVANAKHFKAVIKSLLSGQSILPMPVERRSSANIRKKTIPFVNHHPKTVNKMLEATGFKTSHRLSVSNYRSPGLKKIIPQKLLVSLESASQSPLSIFNFGPSLFLLCHKPS